MKTRLDPAYRSIEEHIRHAQLERSIYLAEAISTGIVAVSRGISGATARLANLWKRRAHPQLATKRALAPR